MRVDDIVLYPDRSEINTMLLTMRRADRSGRESVLIGEEGTYFPVRSAIKKLRVAKGGQPLRLTWEEFSVMQEQLGKTAWSAVEGLAWHVPEPTSREAKYLEGPTTYLLEMEGKYHSEMG